MPSEWNMFVKKIYEEGKAKDSEYEFKQALKDASRRKSEMGHSGVAAGVKHHKKSAKKSRRRRSRSMALSGGRTRRRHRR